MDANTSLFSTLAVILFTYRNHLHQKDDGMSDKSERNNNVIRVKLKKMQ